MRAPEIMNVSCGYLEVHWPAWNIKEDIGDPPVGWYRYESQSCLIKVCHEGVLSVVTVFICTDFSISHTLLP